MLKRHLNLGIGILLDSSAVTKALVAVMGMAALLSQLTYNYYCESSIVVQRKVCASSLFDDDMNNRRGQICLLL